MAMTLCIVMKAVVYRHNILIILCEVPLSDENYWIVVEVIVAWSFHVTEDRADQFHCGTARLVLINGSHSPGLVHPPGWPPAATHQYNTSVSPPRVCLWFGGLFRNVGVYVLCRIWGSPQLRPSNMSVNHALLVRWSSVKGCLADFDVTHTEHAYGLHPY